MARPENRDYTRDSCIRWSPERGLLIVEEKKEDGVISCQQIDPFDLYCALNEGYNNKDFLSSGFLPEHCLSVAMNGSERYFVLWNPELRADLTYLNTEYPDFPLPRLVFGIRMLNTGRIAECSIGVAADESPRPETAMYEYPFSNVHPDRKLCAGNNVLPRYKNILSMKHFPRYVLGLPDNDDLYDREHNRLGLGHAELMEHLKDKDPAYYYTDVLVPRGDTLFWSIRRKAGTSGRTAVVLSQSGPF